MSQNLSSVFHKNEDVITHLMTFVLGSALFDEFVFLTVCVNVIAKNELFWFWKEQIWFQRQYGMYRGF